MKTCINCGVVVEDNAVLFCPKCGKGSFKEIPRMFQKKTRVVNQDLYYEDILPDDAGKKETKKKNTALPIRIALVVFVGAILVSCCIVVVFMM